MRVARYAGGALCGRGAMRAVRPARAAGVGVTVGPPALGAGVRVARPALGAGVRVARPALGAGVRVARPALGAGVGVRVAGAGFEPAKLSRLIYSQLPLAARETRRVVHR